MVVLFEGLVGWLVELLVGCLVDLVIGQVFTYRFVVRSFSSVPSPWVLILGWIYYPE